MIGVLSRAGFAGKSLVFKRENVGSVARMFFESLDGTDQTIVVDYSSDGESWTHGTDVTLKAYGKKDAALPTAGTYFRYTFEGETLVSLVGAYDQPIDHVYGA